MYFDVVINPNSLGRSGEIAAGAEQVGVDALWTTETSHDPFLPLALASATTTRLGLGTAIAVAFSRSPTMMAHVAWDMSSLSKGRFTLGIGTQVKAHIERRFGMQWDAPTERLRDYIGAMRAVWHTWRTGERLRHSGPFYNLRLMTPFFSPEPLPYPDPPIFIAGVNHNLCKLAGEVCDGFHVHPLNSALYLREAVLPWIREGLAAAGREGMSIQVSASVFAIVGQGEERERSREAVRKQISFYASTPSYATVLQLHGWESVGQELGKLAGRGRWDAMPALITDSMLAIFAVEGGTLREAAEALRARYNGLLDRAAFYIPFEPGVRDEEWREAAALFH